LQKNGSAGRFVRFGSFEADLQEGALTKMGSRIRLQEQPFRILVLLLERSGQLVTREEIRQKLWSPDTFVEFDDALNTAVRKLRAALNDSADNPRFLETVPRRGYRFVAPVTWPAEPQGVAPAESRVRQHPYLWLAAALIVALIVAGTAVEGYWHLRRPRELGESVTTVQKFDGPLEQPPEKATSAVQPALASVKVPMPARPRVRRVQAGTNEVDYIGEDVTVRYFTHPLAPQRKPAADGRVLYREVYIGDDVTVRYFTPIPAKRPDSR
jgi:DNA-binding winged helix-turn-helix (wHTH) protein